VGGIDTEFVKRTNPVEEIVRRYGIELRPSGRALVGRCPFHDDGGRPNLYVYPCTGSWYCYRCSVGGDVISFVERIEGVGFSDAVQVLTGGERITRIVGVRKVSRGRAHPKGRMACGPDERACLAAAVDLYHNRLLTDPTALAYIEGRGIDPSVIEHLRLGYVAGDELANYLRWRRLPVGAAMRLGLLGRDGREFLAGRVVVPEIRGGHPIWLVGRTINPDDDRPKYLGMPGPKPLLGWDGAKDSSDVVLVEGVFDWLTLLNWDYPALALVGTHVRSEVLRALTRFDRLHIVLDGDDAGRAAAKGLARTLGNRAVVVSLPNAKDVAELATVPDGRKAFSQALGKYELERAA